MNTFKQWYVRNQDAITWFIIGWMVLSCINNVSKQQYVMALVDAVIVYINYKLRNVKLS
jgi:hypothetical protein